MFERIDTVFVRVPDLEAAFNFYVKDAEAAHWHLRAAGVEVSAVEEGEGVQWFSFQDYCGNALEVCSF